MLHLQRTKFSPALLTFSDKIQSRLKFLRIFFCCCGETIVFIAPNCLIPQVVSANVENNLVALYHMLYNAKKVLSGCEVIE